MVNEYFMQKRASVMPEITRKSPKINLITHITFKSYPSYTRLNEIGNN